VYKNLRLFRRKKQNSKLKALYEKHFEKLYKFFYFKTFSKEVSEDLTSQTFLDFSEMIKKDHQIDDNKAFLYGIARNNFNEYLREKYIKLEIENDAFDYVEYIDSYVDFAEKETEFEKFVIKCIQKLPKKQKRILKMRLVEKKSLKVIADILKKDMNYVKTTQKRGIKKLKEILEKSNKTYT